MASIDNRVGLRHLNNSRVLFDNTKCDAKSFSPSLSVRLYAANCLIQVIQSWGGCVRCTGIVTEAFSGEDWRNLAFIRLIVVKAIQHMRLIMAVI